MWRMNGTAKEEAVDVFRNRNLELLGLIQTKMVGNGEISWLVVNVIFQRR